MVLVDYGMKCRIYKKTENITLSGRSEPATLLPVMFKLLNLI